MDALGTISLILGIFGLLLLACGLYFMYSKKFKKWIKEEGKVAKAEQKGKDYSSEEERHPFGMLGSIIGGFVTLLIGVSLIGPIASQVNAIEKGTTLINNTAASPNFTNIGGVGSNIGSNSIGNAAGNVTSAGTTIVHFIPLFFALAVLMAGIAIVYNGLRNADVI